MSDSHTDAQRDYRRENSLPAIRDKNRVLIQVGDRVTFSHSFDGEIKATTRKVLSTGHNVDQANRLIHTLIKTNLGWRTAYDTALEPPQ